MGPADTIFDAPPDTMPPGTGAVGAMPAPSHRIKIYAKDGGRRCRFISDMTEVPGGECVDVVQLKSTAEVAAVNRALAQILQSDKLAPDTDGWHRVPGELPLPEFLQRLFHIVQKAAWADPELPGRVDLDAAYQPSASLPEALAAMVPAPQLPEAEPPPLVPVMDPVDAPPSRQTWDGPRIAWLGFLVGRGKSAKAIADDPIIRSTPGNVFRQVCRFGLSLSAVPHGEICFALPSWAVTKLDRHAEVAHLQRDAFVQRLVLNALRDGYGVAPRHYREDL